MTASRMAAAAAAPAAQIAGRYDRVTVILHWLMAVALAAQFALGWWMIGLPNTTGTQAPWFNLHKSIGLTLGLLALLRLAWAIKFPAPPLPASLPGWRSMAARASHAGLYFCMLALPITGYLGSSFSGYPIRYFGLVVPSWGWKWPAAKQFLSDVHLGLTWLLVILVVLHIAGVLAHVARQDGLASRMWIPRRPV